MRFHDLRLFFIFVRQLTHSKMREISSDMKTGWSSRHLYLVLLLFICFPSFSAAEIAKINDVRIADRHSNTRVVFDLSSTAKHHVFVLKNPDRVVLDIENCNANGKLKTSSLAGTLIKGMRYA